MTTQIQRDKIKRIEEIVTSNFFKYVWEDPEGYYTEDEQELHDLRNELEKENIEVVPTISVTV